MKLFFAIETALRADIDLPAGELGSQTGILTLVADGQRELVIRYSNLAAAGFLVLDLHIQHISRSQGRTDELPDILRVLDYIDLLAAQLFHDARYTGTLGADAGAHGVHIRVLGPDCHLGTGNRASPAVDLISMVPS